MVHTLPFVIATISSLLGTLLACGNSAATPAFRIWAILSRLFVDSLGLLGELATLRHVLLLEAIRVNFVAPMVKDLVLPVLFEAVDQVLDLEAHTRLHLRVLPLPKHRLQAPFQIVKTDEGALWLVLLLLLNAAFGLVLFALLALFILGLDLRLGGSSSRLLG